MNNGPMVDAVAGQSASRRRFRGWMGFAVHALACVALLAVCPLPAAQAQTRFTWKSSVLSGLWTNGSNWDGGTAAPSSTLAANAVLEADARDVLFGTTTTSGALQVTGTNTLNVKRFYFENQGNPTTVTSREFALWGDASGTAISVAAGSGPVTLSSTRTTSFDNNTSFTVRTNQTWTNDSSSLLSINTGTANWNTPIFFTTSSTLTLNGSGPIALGVIRAQSDNSSRPRLIYAGSNVLTLTSTNNSTQGNQGLFTLQSGTVRIENTNSNTPFGFASGTTTINGGAISQLGTGTTSTPMQVNGSFSFVSGTLIVNPASVTVGNAFTLTVAENAALDFAGASFSGNQQVTKAGLGAMVLSRLFNGSFSGGFKVQEGLLVLQNDTGGNAGTAPLGTGTFTIAGGTISSGRGQGTSLTMPSRFENSFSVAGYTTGTTNFNLGSGTVTLGVDNPTVNVANGAITFTVGPIVGSTSTFGLTKSGPGRLTITGSSTYTGLTTVSSGTLEFTTNGSVDGNIVNNGMVSFNRNAYTYGGVISGSGNLLKGQNVTLTLNGVNTFSGTTSFTSSNPGIITLGSNLGLQNSGIDTTNGNIQFTSAQTAVTFGGLIGSRNLSTVMDSNFTSGTSVTLNPQAGRSFSYSGVIANRTTGSISLTKTGAGEQILSAVNTYTGLTTVSAGRLTIGGGDINASSGVTVNGAGAEFRYNSATAFNKTLTLTQGILSGTGTIQTAVTVGSNAIISPGNSPGSQTYSSSVWQAGGTYLWELNALTGAAGTNWDKVVVTNLNLTGLSTSNKFIIDLTTLTGSNTNGPLDSAYVSGPTYIFPFVDFGSLSVGGTFSTAANSDLTGLFSFNLTNWQGTKPSASDISVKVNSAGNGLNLVIVPEPGTIALAGIGIGTAVWFFRRRRTA